MGNNRDSLGDRMKRYENVPKVSLVTDICWCGVCL